MNNSRRKFIVLIGVALACLFGFGLLVTRQNEDEEIADLLDRERQVAVGWNLNTTRPGSQELDPEVDSSDDADQPVEPLVLLDEQKQTKIWDLEHVTFELEWKFGKLVKQALKQRDKQALANCFRSKFTATAPSVDGRREDQTDWWHQAILRSRADSTQSVNANELAEVLVDVLSDWTRIDKVGLRILAIDKAPDVADQYDLRVLLTANGTAAGGLTSMNSEHDLSVVCANDKEIEAGRIVTAWRVRFVELRGSQKPLMKEVTQLFKLDELELPDNWKLPPASQIDTYTSQIAVEDFDLDGYLDLAISTIQGRQYLLRCIEGRHFQDVTSQMGLPKSRFFSYTTMATWLDYDNDSFPDLLLGKNLYRNLAGKGFQQVTQSVGLEFPAATMGAVTADYDCDGHLDLYVLNHMGERSHKNVGFVDDDRYDGVENQLWRNLGNGTFQDVTLQAGVSGLARHSFAAAWFFANDDHLPDLYLVNDFGRNCMYINEGDGGFVEITEQAGVGDFANSMGVATGDLDNDGTSEIYVANMFSKMGRRIIAHVCADDYPEGIYKGIQGACAGSHLYKRTGPQQSYQEISVEKNVNQIGWAYAPVFADFDADGLLDIYATSGFISVDRRKPDG